MKTGFPERSELTRILWSFRREFFWVGVFSMIANILMLTPTIYLLQVYGRVLVSRNETTLIVLSIIVVIFFGVMAFAEWLRSRLLVQTSVRLDETLNSPIFKSSFDAFLKQAKQNPVSALSDLTTIRQFLTGNGIIAFFDVPWTPVYIIVVFFLHPYLGVMAVVFSLIQLGITWNNNRVTKSGIQCAACAGNDSDAFLASKLRNIEPVYAMGMVGNMRKRWVAYHVAARASQGETLQKQSRQQSFTRFVRYTMQSLSLGAAALLVINGMLTPGAMIATSVLVARSLQPLDLVVGTWKQFIQAKSAFLRTEALLAGYSERQEGRDYGSLKGNISVESLSASAEGRKEPILHGITAEFEPGKIVAVIGPSGSGKSTLSRCLVGVWPEVSGKVMYDGHPIETWERQKLGPHIGYLPQDIELFEGSIAENISRFGDVNSSNIIEAAKKTGIHEMILRFPQGYDTPVGVAGGMLSGGQRQRIALARALYGTPAVIVLDEPNANLDEAGDRALVNAVKDCKSSGKTVIVITHRPNILDVADMILVLQEGNVIHYDTKDSVMNAMRSRNMTSTVTVSS